MKNNMTFKEAAGSLPDAITTKDILFLMEKSVGKDAQPCESCARTFVNRKGIKPSGSKLVNSGRSLLVYDKNQVCRALEEMNGSPASEVDTSVWMPKDEFMKRAFNGEYAKCPGDWTRACLWIDRRKIRLRFNKWQARQQGTNFVNRADLEAYRIKRNSK